MLEAELRGLSSHGVMRLECYTNKLTLGGFNPTPDIRVIKDGPSIAVIDGNNGLGAVVGTRAMSLCIEKARNTGMACVTVRQGNHYGIAAFYSMMALEADMIGITMCTVWREPSISPRVGDWLEPWGSTRPGERGSTVGRFWSCFSFSSFP